jgi:hypothetical protein
MIKTPMTKTLQDQKTTEALQRWLESIYSQKPKLTLLEGDASFRRFYRFNDQNNPFIAMDSSHQDEKVDDFYQVNQAFQAIGLPVPKIIHHDLKQGYFVVTDLGNGLYQTILNEKNCDQLYQLALAELIKLVSADKQYTNQWPVFGIETWNWELEQFIFWYLETYLKITLTENDRKLWLTQFFEICAIMKEQPMVPAHRDYHSRNLLLDGENLGIVDFQDACIAPLTYDLASLLRDCYIDWPETKVLEWLNYYYELLMEKKIFTDLNFSTLEYWFDITGMQRHLKAIFIFARKYARDKNANYLVFIPRALKYILSVTQRYPKFQPMQNWLINHIEL